MSKIKIGIGILLALAITALGTFAIADRNAGVQTINVTVEEPVTVDNPTIDVCTYPGKVSSVMAMLSNSSNKSIKVHPVLVVNPPEAGITANCPETVSVPANGTTEYEVLIFSTNEAMGQYTISIALAK